MELREYLGVRHRAHAARKALREKSSDKKVVKPMPSWRRRKKVPKSLSAKERTKILESLDRMAEKHGIDHDEFLDCIAKAWKQEKSYCNHIHITCREKTEDSAIFLFTTGSEIVAQFPVPTAILRAKSREPSRDRSIHF